jgi:ATP-dependent DNA helicase RecG
VRGYSFGEFLRGVHWRPTSKLHEMLDDAALEKALDRIAGGDTPAALEYELLDFKEPAKSEKATIKSVADAAICLANHRGGTVVLGLDDDMAGPEAFVGTTLDPKRLQRQIVDLTEPPLLVDVREQHAHGAQLLVVRVPESPDVHADKQGRALKREHRDCLPLSPERQLRVREEKQGLDWSARVSPEATVEEVRESAIEQARARLSRYSDGRRELARAPARDLLADLGATDGGSRLTNAGAVMFCPPPPSMASCWIRFLARETPGSEATFTEEIQGSLLEAVDRVELLLDARRRTTALLIPGGQQLELEDFPRQAIREALSNAVLHRDFHPRGPVHLEYTPQIFAIESPGPLVAGVSPQNILRHRPQPRNAALVGMAHTLGLAEEIGTGIDRMYRSMLGVGKQLPEIANEPDAVRVSLVGGAPDTQVARFFAQLPAREREDVDTLLTIFYLRARRTVEASDLTELTQRPESEVAAVLDRLAGDDVALIEPTRKTHRLRRPTYRLRDDVLRSLGTAVSYQRRTVDETDRKVIEIVANYGRINNQAMQTLFSVKVARASTILRDLVDRGILERTSEATRGPSVEYGPGPRFPRTRRRRRAPAQHDAG